MKENQFKKLEVGFSIKELEKFRDIRPKKVRVFLIEEPLPHSTNHPIGHPINNSVGHSFDYSNRKNEDAYFSALQNAGIKDSNYSATLETCFSYDNSNSYRKE